MKSGIFFFLLFFSLVHAVVDPDVVEKQGDFPLVHNLVDPNKT